MKGTRFVLPSYAKLNLTLRVTGRRPDGYHNLVSVFVRIASGETLFIAPLSGGPDGTGRDIIEVRGLDLRLEGENIVSKALRLTRERLAVPPVRVEIAKALYPGSGLGSGSGNAAAMLAWLAGTGRSGRSDCPWPDIACRVGADVPFLCSGLPAALVSGIGEELTPLRPLHAPRVLHGVVILPEWDVGTGNAYAALDKRSGGRYPLNEEGARQEAENIFNRLGQRERIGLLPNDFLPPLVEARPEYLELFALFESTDDALAWGITGSGGGAFALFRDRLPALEWPGWVRQVLCLSPLH